MRLGQLARKLTLRPVEIVDYLALRGIQIDNSGNTRLEDEHVAMVMQEFAPDGIEENAVGLTTGTETQPASIPPKASAITQPSLEINGTEIEESVESSTGVSPEGEDKIEVIKAPKIELTGLKVLGKIDLPEPKKKDAVPLSGEPNPASTVEGKKSGQDFRRPYPERRDASRRRPEKNPIALQREREATEANKKRMEDLEREKERRALHYHKKVKAAPPTKRVRLVDEPVEEFPASALVEPPKTWWGKFMKWLNT